MASLNVSQRALLLAKFRASSPERWLELVRPAPQQGLFQGTPDEPEVTPSAFQHAQRLLEVWDGAGMRFVPLGDARYPSNLARGSSPPPFLFLRGNLLPQDERCVAVIGTRRCSEEGRRRALKLGQNLAEAGLTVISGLALGVDTAAHEGALSFPTGRTLAVVGTGLDSVYPPENRELQERLLTRGAVLSQFWPDFQGLRGGANFLSRNRTMADLCLGTVVVEAGFRSGARSQAVYAQKSGSKVFLLRSLVESQDWARQMADKPNGFVVAEVSDILAELAIERRD